jgi:HPt (histidine-containing phosphotransfer) domain-containing protein
VSVIDLAVAGQLASSLAPADFGRILESFAQDVCRLTDEMEAADREGDAAGLRRAAHGLAGAAAAVGAAALEALARRGMVEEAAPAGPLVTEIRQAGQQAVDALRALPPLLPAAPDP